MAAKAPDTPDTPRVSIRPVDDPGQAQLYVHKQVYAHMQVGHMLVSSVSGDIVWHGEHDALDALVPYLMSRLAHLPQDTPILVSSNMQTPPVTCNTRAGLEATIKTFLTYMRYTVAVSKASFSSW